MIMQYRTSWGDYFPGTNPTTSLISKDYTSSQTISGTYVHVSNCFFSKCTSSSAGGAIRCTSVTYLLIESSSFFSCKTSSGSGAIYLSNSGNSECVLHEICGNDCYSTSSEIQFASITVRNAASSKNYINYSSIVRCVNENTNSWCNLYLYNGRICCTSVNMSLNKCYGQTTISCHPFTDSSSAICSLSYSSFADNTATQSRCIHFNNGGSKYEMKCCNILRNIQVSFNSDGTISLNGNLKIMDSCILENNAKYDFHASSSSYSFTLSNCTVDKTTTSTGGLTIQNTVTKSFILALNHMSTLNCHSEYDSAGTLTPIIRTPSSSKKIRVYYSCEKFFYQSPLRDFFTLSIILTYNFIHPYSSSNPL
jgi:hypothetical protein